MKIAPSNPDATPTENANALATRLLRITEVASQLGLSKRSVTNLLAARELAVVKIGRAVRFRQEDIDTFIGRKLVKPAGWKKP